MSDDQNQVISPELERPTPPPVKDDEPQYLTEEKFKGYLEEINKTITGAVGRAKRDTASDVREELTKQNEMVKGMLEKLMNFQSAGQVQQPENEKKTDPKQNGNVKPDAQYTEMEERLQALADWRQQQAEMAEKQAQRIKELEESTRREKLKNHWNKISAEKVHAPEQLLKLALDAGDLRLVENEPVVQTKEITGTGEYKVLSGTEAVDYLIQQENYNHFKKAPVIKGTGSTMGLETPMPNQRTVVEGIPIGETDEEASARIAKEYGYE